MSDKRIDISLADQRLRLLDGESVLAEYRVSTARNGPGERVDSGCTPRGRHEIAACIGAGAPLNTVFVSREPTGELWTPELAAAHPDRDWILTRIMVLAGLEPGFNQGGEVDTWSRFIYIHGTPDTEAMGEPGSHGCVRMRNRDVVELFEQVAVGTVVQINE